MVSNASAREKLDAEQLDAERDSRTTAAPIYCMHKPPAMPSRAFVLKTPRRDGEEKKRQKDRLTADYTLR
jgi:hypothetical protein